MGVHPIILLPGLDGTAKLFDRFLAVAPSHLSITPVALPSEKLTYGELADAVDTALPSGPIVVIAESFSGPLAITLAARRPIAGLVFCNSFIVAPQSRLFRLLFPPIMFKLPPPLWLLRRYMLGSDADDALVRRVAEVVASVPAAVLASRLECVLGVNEVAAFAQTTAPALYLQGTADRLVPESALQQMAALRPVTTARLIGPHLLLQTNPTGAWEAILPFLDSLPGV